MLAYLRNCILAYLHTCILAYLHFPAYLHSCILACLHVCILACLHTFILAYLYTRDSHCLENPSRQSPFISTTSGRLQQIYLRGGFKKKYAKFGLLAEPPLTPPPSPNLGPIIRLIFLLFYSNLHLSKHETALWSTSI